jgi:gliding motility-associated-like protein
MVFMAKIVCSLKVFCQCDFLSDMKVRNIFFILLFLIHNAGLVFGQNCNVLSKANDLIPNQTCAPVNVSWEVIYRGVIGTNIAIVYEWDDGRTDVLPVNETAPGSREYRATHTHTYAPGQDQCTYKPRAFLRVDGQLCPSSIQEQVVTVWDLDNANGGQPRIEPELYRICVGESATLNFNDVSLWNCVPPAENDNLNNANRWIRWTYGTTHNPRPKINNVQVNGIVRAYPFQGDVAYLPAPVIASGQVSQNIAIPDNATVGRVFEVTLENWNQCNPYEVNGVPTGNDPIITRALVEIVAAPQPNFFTRKTNANGPAQSQFCIGEAIYLHNQTPNVANSDHAFTWEIYDGPTDASTRLFTRNNRNTTISFQSSGQKLIRLRVRDRNSFGNCERVYDGLVTIIPTATANIGITDEADNPLTPVFCKELGSNESFQVKFHNTTPAQEVTPQTQWRWEFYDVNGNLTKSVPANGYHPNRLDPFVEAYTQPGTYRVKLIARDNGTSCFSEREVFVHVYNKPVADFSFTQVCQGATTRFNNLSSLVVVNDDRIIRWEWDFNYDGVTFNPQRTDNTHVASFNRNLGAAGKYQVALRVTTEKGQCTSLVVKEVDVLPLPVASFTVDTHQGCTDLRVNLTNTAHGNHPEGIAITQYVWKIENGSGNVTEIPVNPNQANFNPLLSRTFVNNTEAAIEFKVSLLAQASNGCAVESDKQSITVFPAPQSGFSVFNYVPFEDNCSPVKDVQFVPDAFTRSLNVREYKWIISDNTGIVGTIIKDDVSRDDFHELVYDFINEGNTAKNYTIRLEVALQNEACVKPSQRTVRVNPVPSSAFVAELVTLDCDFVAYDLRALSKGLPDYEWSFSHSPYNEGSLVMPADVVRVIFERPENEESDLLVELGLQTTNSANCVSTMTFDEVTIPKKERIYPEITLDVDQNVACLPFTAMFYNTTPSYPEGTVFELRVRKDGVLLPKSIVDANITGDVNGHFSYGFSQHGRYVFELRASTMDKCSFISYPSLEIEVHSPSKAIFSASQEKGCHPLNVFFDEKSLNASIRYWTITDKAEGVVLVNRSQDFNGEFTFENSSLESKDYEVFLEVESEHGCFSDTVLNLLVYPGASSSFDIVSSNPSCKPHDIRFSNNSVNPEQTVYHWFWGDGSDEKNQADTLVHHYQHSSFSTNRNVNVRLEAKTDKGCATSSSKNIVLNATVQAGIAADKEKGCAPLDVNFNNFSQGAIPALGAWYYQIGGEGEMVKFSESFSPGFTFENNTSNVLNYTITYVARNLGGCTDTATISLEVYPMVVPELSLIGESASCLPFKSRFENVSKDMPGQTLFELVVTRNGFPVPADRVANAFSGDIQQEFAYQFNQPGEYVFELKATTSHTCTYFTSSKAEVEIYALPKAIVSSSSANGCAPLTVAFDERSTYATHKFWTIKDLTDGETMLSRKSEVPADVVFENETLFQKEYEVLLEIESENGCKSDTSVFVSVFPIANSSFEIVSPNPSCAPHLIEFANVSIGPEGTVYEWFWGDGSSEISTETVLNHSYQHASFTMPRNVLVRLEATTQKSCKTEFSRPLTLNPAIKSDFLVDKTQGCAPLDINLTNLSQGASSSQSGWFYKTADDEEWKRFSEARSPVYFLENKTGKEKTYTISYLAVNNAGCRDTSSLEVKVYPEVTAIFTSDKVSGCNPLNVSFTNQNIRKNVQYTWKWGDGNEEEVTFMEKGIAHTFINNDFTRNRNYTVSLHAKDTVTQCQHFAESRVQVFPNIVLNVMPDKVTGCAPLEVNVNNQSLGVTHHLFFTRIKGEVAREQITNRPQPGIVFNNNTDKSITYELVYKGNNASGCMVKDSFDIVVHPEIKVDFIASPLWMQLPESRVNLINLTNKGNWNYTWDFGNGVTSTHKDISHYEYATYGEYDLQLRAEKNGCQSSKTVRVVIEPKLPIVDFSYTPNSGCRPVRVEFTNLSKYADPKSYRWDFGDGKGFSTEKNPVYTYFDPGKYTVKLTASNSLGEEIEVIKEYIIEVYDYPRAAFQVRPKVVYLPGNPVFTSNLSFGASEFIWDFGDGRISKAFEPQHIYEQPGDYTVSLKVKNEYGCADSLVLKNSVKAEAAGQIRVPNAFSPSVHGPSGGQIGKGGLNDIFYPLTEGMVEFNMLIYNRWGELLFESTRPNIGWDGYHKGKLCPQDVYIYKIKAKTIDGEVINRVGDVTLVR